MAAMALPSAQIGRAPLIYPGDAEKYYVTDVTSTNSTGITTPPNEIVELARGLGNNVDEIYDFVRNYVDTVFIFGAQKGSLGALIDKAGTPFDQAKLMVDLLHQAGYTTASYQFGTITLNGAQFQEWTNITNLQAACDLLASGGIPASLNGSSSTLACTSLSSSATVSSVTLDHVWVQVPINGTTYVFDPSYKPYNFTAPVNLASAAGLTSGQSLTAATGTGYSSGALSSGGGAFPYVQGLNASGLNSQLATYASNIQSYIQSANSTGHTPLASGKLLDLVGGREISPFNTPLGGLRQATLPYLSSATRPAWQAIPDVFRCSLTITLTKALNTGAYVNAINGVKLYVDDIYGRKLTYLTNFNQDSFSGSLEIVDEFGNATQLSNYTDQMNPGYAVGTITIAVNHPYAADAAGSLTTQGTYMDEVITRNLRYATPFTIVHGWGEANRGLVDKWATRLDDALPLMCPLASDTCGDSPASSAGDGRREQLAASWLVQGSLAARLHASIANAIYTHHHTVGIVSGDTEVDTEELDDAAGNETYLFEVADSFDRIDADTAFSVTSLTESASDRRVAIHAIAATLDALEGAQSAQIADLPDTTSTATRFEWGNSPPTAEDPSAVPSGSVGPRRFLDFNSMNVGAAGGQSGVQSLLLVEGKLTTTQSDIHNGGEPTIGPAETTARQSAVANLLTSYATAGFDVVGSQEAFLGPGQRGGSYIPQNGGGSSTHATLPTIFMHRYSKQRGGAFVATLYNPSTGDPTQIAHISANVDYGTGLPEGIKGGGGGAQPDHQATYDPATAADVLKAKFVDRSKVLGVDMLSGGLTYQSPATLSVGSGPFPYSLSANMTWRGGILQDARFGPISHIAPNAPWTTNWNNSFSISGSALELLDPGSDARATAGTVAAFMAMQDIYRAAVSPQRDVTAVLAGAWWTHQLAGNVATAAVGTDTKQFLRKYDGTWFLPGSGSYATLTQTGSRVAYTQFHCGGPPTNVTYVQTRGWDYSGTSFTVTNAQGDQQNFQFWGANYQMDQYCAFQHGFELSSWTFPYGVTINLTYVPDGTNLPALTQVSNSLGTTLYFTNSGLGGFSDGNGRSVTISDTGYGVIGTATAPWVATHKDPTGAVTTLNYTITTPNYTPSNEHRYLLTTVFTPDSATNANLSYSYDTLMRVESAQDAVALWYPGTRNPYTFYYGEKTRAGRMDPAGGDYTIYYDIYQRPMAYEDELDRFTNVTHDGRGRVTGYTYPEGDQQLFSYDDHNNTTSLTRMPVLGSTLSSTLITAQWDQTWNKPIKIWDALNNETDFQYYPSGSTGASLLNTATRPSPDGVQPHPIYSFTYTTIGRVFTATDPTNVVTSNTYDSSGNLHSTTLDPSGINATTTYGYDAVGNLTTVTDPRAYVTENQYDLDRRKKVVLHHNGNISAAVIAAEQTQYDVLGRVLENDGGIGFSGTSVTTWQMLNQSTYTPTGKVQTEKDGANDQTNYTYDPMDREVIVMDPVSQRVASVYDLAGEKLATWRGWNSSTPPTVSTAWNPSAYPGSGPIRYGVYTYFLDGEQATITDANNNLTSMTYDGFQRLSQVNFPVTTLGALSSDASDFEKYGYDANNNRTSVQRRDGQVINYHFDNLNRQTIKDLPGTTTGDVYSGYDPAGRPAYDNFGSPTGQGVAYAYDTAGRLKSETQFGLSMSYQYDPSSNRAQVTWPDNNNVIYTFDALNRVSQVEENGATSGPGLLAVYSYDSLSRVSNIARGNGTATNLGYDAASRLQSLGQDFAGGAQDLTLGFQYTLASQLHARANSNPLYEWMPVASSTAYAPDGLNRYANVSGATYTYDLRGNLISDRTNTYSYDVENRLLSASGPTAVNLTYDPLGRLQQTQTSSATTQFLYAGTQLIAEYDGSGHLLRRYVFGPGGGDDPIVWYEGADFSQRNYLHADERGSIIATSDGSGTASPYTYGPYGEPTSWSGSRFRYTGQMAIPEANLYYYKARVYSPVLGRFLQTDPIGGQDDLNLYAYTHDDPIDGADPSGLGCGSRLGDAPNCKTYGPSESGTPQKTRGANGQQHADASKAQAREVAAGAQVRGERVDSTVYNRSAKNATGGVVDSNMRADSVVNTTSPDGTKNVYINEVTSPSQNDPQQIAKWDAPKASAPEGVRVTVLAEDAASILGRVGSKLFAAAPVIGALPTVVEAEQHPMTTMEFFWKAAGMEEIAREKGWLPPVY